MPLNIYIISFINAFREFIIFKNAIITIKYLLNNNVNDDSDFKSVFYEQIINNNMQNVIYSLLVYFSSFNFLLRHILFFSFGEECLILFRQQESQAYICRRAKRDCHRVKSQTLFPGGKVQRAKNSSVQLRP